MKRHADRIRTLRNRGSTHIFLGDPRSDGCDKTVVEPGNVYSPGVWTCGISLWTAAGRRLASPETIDEKDIDWCFSAKDGFAPVIEARYTMLGVAVHHRLAHIGGEGANGADFNEVRITPSKKGTDILIAVRDVGPAGAKIRSLDWDAGTQTLLVNGSLRLTMETAAACVIFPADKKFDSPIAIISVRIPNDGSSIRFRTEHGFAGRTYTQFLPEERPFSKVSVSEGIARTETQWKHTLPARIIAPDERIVRAYEASAQHMLAAMECSLPRIGAVNYPHFWMRDCVIVLRALDRIGRHDLARIGCDHLAPMYFSGGFGAESDAPGEGVWALAQHARMNSDREWAKTIFPHIEARIAWLKRMLSAKTIIRAVTENRVPHSINSPGINVLCLPAKHGLIDGRMDGHKPNLYINAWAYAGFSFGAEAAVLAGRNDRAAQWRARAADIDARIAEHLLPEYGNDRDPIVSPYPTGVLAGQRKALSERFASFYRSKRLDASGRRRPEKAWTYFEAAQAHNAMLLGLREEAWTTLSGMLDDGAWPVHAWIEGAAGGNEHLPFRNDIGARGWLSEKAHGGNMPHNWTSAEMITFIRDMFVRDDGDALVLGDGIPSAWLYDGAVFGVSDMPTRYGAVSYRAHVKDGAVTVSCKHPNIRLSPALRGSIQRS